MTRPAYLIVVISIFAALLLIPAGAMAADVGKVVKSCFSPMNNVALDVGAKMGEAESMPKAMKKEMNEASQLLDKTWTTTAKCIAEKLSPKSGSNKTKNLVNGIRRGGEVWNATNAKDWWDEGYINNCIFDKGNKIFESTENLTKSAEFKKLSKKKKKARLKEILDNQKKIMKGEVGGCMKKENKKYLKRLVKYLKENYDVD